MASLASGTISGSFNGSEVGVGAVASLAPGSKINEDQDRLSKLAGLAAAGTGAVVTVSEEARRLAAATGSDGSGGAVGATAAIGATSVAGAKPVETLAANATPGLAPVFTNGESNNQGTTTREGRAPATVNSPPGMQGADATLQRPHQPSDAAVQSATSTKPVAEPKDQSHANAERVATSAEGSKAQTDAKTGASTATGKTQNLTPEQQATIEKMKQRDREVRAHEQAHKAVGGGLAGAISLTTEQGPDGQSYAVGGSVPIDVTPVKGDAEATIRKMQKVQAAALAPADPSGPDLQVAAAAAAYMAEAVKERSQNKNADPSEQKPGKVSATFHVSG